MGAIMDLMDASDLLAAGSRALSRGEWAAARDAFESAWSIEESADALDGLARAMWWLNDPAGALGLRAQVFGRLRHDGRDAEAAEVAIWLAREYRGRYRRAQLADGWLARARSLLAGIGDADRLDGWLALAESEAEPLHPHAAAAADRAVAVAREHGDTDLEIVALMRRGACKVAGGAVTDGIADVHEAMAAATSGEGQDVQYVGEALCTLLEVGGWLGDPGMVEPWASFLVDYRSSYAFGPLLPFEATSPTDLISAFCTACCGGVFLVTGRLDAAEDALTRAVTQLITAGLRPRCLNPVADLVELRVLQGRLQEAEATLTGFEDDLECAAPAADLDVALGSPKRAVQRLAAAIEELADTPLLALPLHAALVDAALADGDIHAAERSAAFVAGVAETTGTVLHRAQRDHAAGKIALAEERAEATALLRSAALGFAQAGVPLPACRARLALARSLVPRDRGLAVSEARSALQAFDRMGAVAEADRAAAFLRGLGVRGRTGPRNVGLLSNREREVLGLVAGGMSNAEIGERLFISTKTVGHHVSSILGKLGVRSRTEAVAFALLNVPASPVDEVRS